ncbi:hypothetical protein Q5P01_000135 [Channa striata]|uniref:Uncharacterized protein n=1 Tax=Channa striata TaxID=64152 RepID=A0AA88LFD4_CHASR|nr:hypothetical protein Q5P01_000135 [Channa striata]
MAEPETDDLALSVFRSVRALSSDVFEDIMRRHYGSDAIPKETPRTTLTEGYKNLSAYLRITHRLGKREEAVTEIREAHREMMCRGKTGFDEIEGEAESRDSSQADNAEIEAAKALMELGCAGRYVDTVECNTTRSCYLEIGIHPPYHCRHEGWSDEDEGQTGPAASGGPRARGARSGESDPMRGEQCRARNAAGLLPIAEGVEDASPVRVSRAFASRQRGSLRARCLVFRAIYESGGQAFGLLTAKHFRPAVPGTRGRAVKRISILASAPLAWVELECVQSDRGTEGGRDAPGEWWRRDREAEEEAERLVFSIYTNLNRYAYCTVTASGSGDLAEGESLAAELTGETLAALGAPLAFKALHEQSRLTLERTRSREEGSARGEDDGPSTIPDPTRAAWGTCVLWQRRDNAARPFCFTSNDSTELPAPRRTAGCAWPSEAIGLHGAATVSTTAGRRGQRRRKKRARVVRREPPAPFAGGGREGGRDDGKSQGEKRSRREGEGDGGEEDPDPGWWTWQRRFRQEVRERRLRRPDHELGRDGAWVRFWKTFYQSSAAPGRGDESRDLRSRPTIGKDDRVALLGIMSELFLSDEASSSPSGPGLEARDGGEPGPCPLDQPLATAAALRSRFESLVSWFKTFEGARAREASLGLELATELCGCYDAVLRRLLDGVADTFLGKAFVPGPRYVARADRVLAALADIAEDRVGRPSLSSALMELEATLSRQTSVRDALALLLAPSSTEAAADIICSSYACAPNGGSSTGAGWALLDTIRDLATGSTAKPRDANAP